MDPLNVQIVIRTLIKQNKKKFSINIVDMQKGGYKEYDFEVLGNEKCIFNKEVRKKANFIRCRWNT